MENNRKPSSADSGDDKAKRSNKFRPQKRKVCQFCVDKVDSIGYRDVAKLKRFITEKGKIVPRHSSGVCAAHQRVLAQAIKNARIMALLPFKAE